MDDFSHGCKICPVCGENPAVSEHHVSPRAEGGTDTARNKVRLCGRCHDIVEEIYDRTGLSYGSGLVKLIQLEYSFPPVARAVELTGYDGGSRRPRIIRFREPSRPKCPRAELSERTCARCGSRFRPTKDSQALCQLCGTRKTTGREVVARAKERLEERTARRERFAELRKGLLDARNLPELLAEVGNRVIG